MKKLFKTLIITASLPFLLTGCNSTPQKGDTGPQGVPGEKGEPGQDGVSVVSIAKTSSSGNVDIYTITYSNGTTSNFLITNGVNGEQGIQGIPGNDGHTPVITIGLNGDWFVDGVDSMVKAQGPQGIPGEAGNSFLQGSTNPTSAIGNNGDTYLNTTTYDLYYKVNGLWIFKCNVKGEDAITYIPCIFNNYDGTKLYEFYYEKGSDIVYEGPTPTHPEEIIDGIPTIFEFNGWDKPLNNILNPTIFTAVFTKKPKSGEHGVWDITPGSHEKVIDFVNDYSILREGFPYIGSDTGIVDAKLDGLSIKDRGSFVNIYNGSGYLMMKNKDMDGNAAFIASQYPLGEITEVTFTTGSVSSANAVYNVLISDAPQLNSSSEGTSFTGTGGTVTGSGKYFCISCTSVGEKTYNGQIGVIKVKYTISEEKVSKTKFNGYYSEYADDLNSHSSTLLQNNLHKLCLDTHSIVIKYSQYASFNAKSSKPQPIDDNGNGGLQMFYTGKEVAYGNIGSREHIWACANSSGLWTHSGYSSKEYGVDQSGYWGGGSDLYHVRPTTSKINTARGNAKFYEFQTNETYYENSDGGPYILKTNTENEFATKTEPADEMKGDVARIIMYVYIHYKKMGTYNWYYDDEQTKCVMGDLNLNQVFAYSDMNDIYSIIKKWNALDPVSQVEIDRNNTIQQIQGNRNPFVDYPELIDKIF